MVLGKNQQIPKIIFKSTLFVIFILIAPSMLKAKEKPILTFGAGITHNRDANVFYKGEPIYVGVSLQRTDSKDMQPEETLQIGTIKAPWHEDVNISLYKLNIKNKIVDVNIISYIGSSKNELVKTNEADRASWIIEPNSTSRLLPGKYLIDISFNEVNVKKAHSNINIEYRGIKIEIDINEPENDKQKAEVIANQGVFYSRKNKQETAIKLFRQALELDPTRQDIHCAIGSYYEASGDLDNAIKEYQIYVDWVRSLNIPRTGGDDINLHADIIEDLIKILGQIRKEK